MELRIEDNIEKLKEIFSAIQLVIISQLVHIKCIASDFMIYIDKKTKDIDKADILRLSNNFYQLFEN